MSRTRRQVESIKRLLSLEMAHPSEDLLRLVARRLYPGELPSGALDRLADDTQVALRELVQGPGPARTERPRSEDEATFLAEGPPGRISEYYLG